MTPEEEFYNADTNYSVLMAELRQRLTAIQLDRESIRDPEIRGEAERIYSNLKIEYFRLLKDYTSLVVLSKDLDENFNEEE